MNANQTPVIWTVVIAAVVLLVIGAFGMSGLNSNLKLATEKLDGLDIDETALANAIVAGIVIPEVTIPEVDTKKVDDLWQTLFVDCIDDLKGLVYSENLNTGKRTLVGEFLAEYQIQFDENDAIEYIEDNLADFDEFFGVGISGYDVYDKKEVGFEIVQIGECEASNGITYYEDGNSKIIVELEGYDFTYTKVGEPINDIYEGTLYVTVTAEYDGIDLEDLEVTYSL